MRLLSHKTATDPNRSAVICLAFASAAFADTIPAPALTTAGTANPQQAQKQPQTKLEAFLGVKGTLLIRDITDFGTIDAVNVEAVTAYEPGKEEAKTRGFILSASSEVSSVTVYVDYDEAKSLTQALIYMQGLSQKWRGLSQNYKEASYITTGGLKVTFYHTADGKHQDAKIYLTDGITLNTDMKYTEFASFKGMIDQGIVWLDKQ